jgi:hypothetical protein
VWGLASPVAPPSRKPLCERCGAATKADVPRTGFPDLVFPAMVIAATAAAWAAWFSGL